MNKLHLGTEKSLSFLHKHSYLHISHEQDMNYSLQEYVGLSVWPRSVYYRNQRLTQHTTSKTAIRKKHNRKPYWHCLLLLTDKGMYT